MVLPATKIREVKISLLWSSAHGDPDRESLVNLAASTLKVSKKNVYTCLDQLNPLKEKIDEIDAKIKEYSEYPVFSLNSIERTILRFAVYEMVFEKKCAPKVVISEAIRLSNKFALPTASKLINGILDAVFHSMMQNEKKCDDQVSSSEDTTQVSSGLSS